MRVALKGANDGTGVTSSYPNEGLRRPFRSLQSDVTRAHPLKKGFRCPHTLRCACLYAHTHLGSLETDWLLKSSVPVCGCLF